VTLKGPSGSENKTLKGAGGAVYQGNVPLDSQGANGDWWSRDTGGTGASRQSPPVLYGPKANGVWPTEFKRVLPNSPRYMADAKSITSLGIGPVSLGLTVIENVYEAPTANPFTAVTGSWAGVAPNFYSTNRATSAIAVMASVGVATYSNPPPLTQFGLVTVNTLPSATDGAISAVGVGSLHPSAIGYGYAVWVDYQGRFCLGKWNTGLNIGASSYLTATGTGVVTAGRKVAFLRIGSLFQGFVFTNTNVLVANTTLSAIIDGSDDGSFATGPAVFAHRTQDARLNTFYGIT
jgi:hypothetical protein